MLFPSFGQAIAQELTPIKQVSAALRGSEKKSLGSYETQLLLRELYDQNFQIADHNNNSRPMSLVAMQTKETQGPYSRTYRLYQRFASLDVGGLFKLSITEFLAHTREEVEMMFTIAEHHAQTKGQQDSATLGRIEQQMRADK